MAAAKTKQQRRVPSYRSRAGYTHALVTLTDSATGKRRDYWLGPHGSPESREAYHRVLAEWEANGRCFPDDRLSGWRKPLEVGSAAPPPLRDATSGTQTPDLITRAVGVESSTRGTLTVNDLIVEYWRFAKGYYGGSSLYSIKMALRVLSADLWTIGGSNSGTGSERSPGSREASELVCCELFTLWGECDAHANNDAAYRGPA